MGEHVDYLSHSLLITELRPPPLKETATRSGKRMRQNPEKEKSESETRNGAPRNKGRESRVRGPREDAGDAGFQTQAKGGAERERPKGH